MEPPEMDMFRPLTLGGSKGTTRVLKLLSSEMWQSKDKSKHSPGQCKDSQKLQTPFWDELRKGVSHQTRICEDETSEQAH